MPTSLENPKAKQNPLDPIDWMSFRPGPIVGVDEVGRGCLAGPVYACAAILPAGFKLKGMTDSKLLSERRREELALYISEHAQVGLGCADEEEIAQLNILHASLLAMRRAVDALRLLSGHVLVDGNQRIRDLGCGLKQTTIVKGDLRAAPISAASIVAKTVRDQSMRELALSYPEYGFETNKGYGSETHRKAIEKHGPCPSHRREFSGVREHWGRVRAQISRARDDAASKSASWPDLSVSANAADSCGAALGGKGDSGPSF